ncbi:MAG: isoprenylcysteine carboxylmethyltransferase family protein [Campylobacteraceae bacterium]|nr:isoprenylcysteine carboxylmethyltransferase family protein [Campylobacteraceae bacterium]
MQHKLYSYTLVSLQFLLIGALLLFGTSLFSSVLAILIFIGGAVMGMYALFYNNLKNINIIPEIKEDAVLITTGAYAYIRHPMYFSVLIMMLGVVVADINMISMGLYLLLIITLLLKAHKEEKLWMEKSEAYRAYRQRTKSIIPFIV